MFLSSFCKYISQLGIFTVVNPMFIYNIYFHDSRASDFGLMKIDNKGRVLSFSEKPKGNDLKAMVTLKFLIHLNSES